MEGFRIRVRVALEPRLPAWPRDDEALGRALTDRLAARMLRGPIRPAAVILRADTVHILDLVPLLQSGRDARRLIAGLAGGAGVEALALVGPMTRRFKGQVVERLAGVFVEWSDGRWWASFRPVDEHGRPIATDTDDVQRALDGAPRPGGLGGWFSLARFHDLHAELSGRDEPPASPEIVN